MTNPPSQESIRQMILRWSPNHPQTRPFRIHTDTSDFFQVDYNDVLILENRPYLIRHNAKEGRFGVDDEVKHWVKRAVDLEDGSRKIIKLVFYERMMSRIGGVEFECFRSPKKEARILDLVAGRPNFMQGRSVRDEKDNIIRILDFIEGRTIAAHVDSLAMGHEPYYYEHFPGILEKFAECVQAVRFLHDNGEKHGDIRRDHILIDRNSGDYRWIDFDFNYRHRENIYGYDLFGLGNVLVYLAGKGDVLLPELKKSGRPLPGTIDNADLNIIFRDRVVNLKKVYPYISDSLNQVLLHFSTGANRFYEHAGQLLDDLGACGCVRAQARSRDIEQARIDAH